MTDAADGEAVLATNRAFYEAFEARDIDAMSDLWEHADDVACTHPGWRTLHGWAAVVSSWMALFGGGSLLQFIVTNERVRVVGDAAWVTLEENIMGEGLDGPGALGSTVAALNLFRRRGDDWLMVAHHGSPVVPG